MIKGYCAVTADILHVGHIRYIQKCRRDVDYLVVGVMTDDCVERYKGARPVIPYEQRAEIVENIKGVDKVVPQLDFEFDRTWAAKGYVIFDSIEHVRQGCDYLMTRTPGISSSDIKRKIYESLNNSQRKV